jgi:hypothetical protein
MLLSMITMWFALAKLFKSVTQRQVQTLEHQRVKVSECQQKMLQDGFVWMEIGFLPCLPKRQTSQETSCETRQQPVR